MDWQSAIKTLTPAGIVKLQSTVFFEALFVLVAVKAAQVMIIPEEAPRALLEVT